MRMRQLGKGQSVELYATAEIHREILQCAGQHGSSIIGVAEVLIWTISETFQETRKCMPLWATQGVKFQFRESTWSSSRHLGGQSCTREGAIRLLEPEARTLAERYERSACGLEEQIVIRGEDKEELVERREQIQEIREKCEEFNLFSLSGAALQEEQERELCLEAETESRSGGRRNCCHARTISMPMSKALSVRAK